MQAGLEIFEQSKQSRGSGLDIEQNNLKCLMLRAP
jgi:hypothetical protein